MIPYQIFISHLASYYEVFKVRVPALLFFYILYKPLYFVKRKYCSQPNSGGGVKNQQIRQKNKYEEQRFISKN